MAKASGWKLRTPTAPPPHAGDLGSVRSATVRLSVNFRPNLRYLVPRLLAGECQGFPYWHFQSFAQRGEICITRANPAAFPVIDRYLGDTQAFRQLGDGKTFDHPSLADLLT